MSSTNDNTKKKHKKTKNKQEDLYNAVNSVETNEMTTNTTHNIKKEGLGVNTKQ